MTRQPLLDIRSLGVVAVILTQAIQGIIDYVPKGG